MHLQVIAAESHSCLVQSCDKPNSHQSRMFNQFDTQEPTWKTKKHMESLAHTPGHRFFLIVFFSGFHVQIDFLTVLRLVRSRTWQNHVGVSFWKSADGISCNLQIYTHSCVDVFICMNIICVHLYVYIYVMCICIAHNNIMHVHLHAHIQTVLHLFTHIALCINMALYVFFIIIV